MSKESEFIVDNGDIVFIGCCDCSLVHAFFVEIIDDRIRLVSQRDNTATQFLRQRGKIKVFKNNKEIDACGLT